MQKNKCLKKYAGARGLTAGAGTCGRRCRRGRAASPLPGQALAAAGEGGRGRPRQRRGRGVAGMSIGE